MHPEEKEKLVPQVFTIIRERQASPDNMVEVATLEPLFAAEGLRYADYGFASLRDFLNEFRAFLNLVDGIPAGAGLPAKSYVQLKNFEGFGNAVPELSAAEKAALEDKLREVFATLVPNEEGWVNLATFGTRLKEYEVDVKHYGFQKIMPFLEQFTELLELKREPSPSGKAWVAFVRERGAVRPCRTESVAIAANAEEAAAEERSLPELTAAEKAELAPRIQAAFRSAASNEEGWANLAGLGAPLKENGVDAKQLGFQKIMPFLEQFPELLELKHEPSPSGKAWVAYARLRAAETALPAGRAGDGPSEHTARADAEQTVAEASILLQALRQRWQLWEATNRAKRSSRRKKRRSLARRFVRRFALRFRMKRAGST
ncbi:OST-HTH/LOTUS domain-containing protein [Stomatobaculum longum]|uniref:OST-HTH/LOTUS domain-containing protein n=1 Tax=Stomatobaculum longum TaxID=796942 RepID=UPI0028E3B983|nr:OST-HTH/LOTUS domain-containing protein [Stomatobaculum longum]